MDDPKQAHLAFYLTSQRQGGVEPAEGFELCPALLAPYRELARLRYDFPLVLTTGGEGSGVESLSGLFDRLRHGLGEGDDRLRLNRHLFRLEAEIRRLSAGGAGGSLSFLWNRAAERLGSHESSLLQDSLDRARAALPAGGEVVDCNAAFPMRFLKHLWKEEQVRKARRYQEEANRLAHGLSEILRGDSIRSEAGRSAQNLEASFGSQPGGAFDFVEMSRLLAMAPSARGLTKSRRQRILGILSALETQRFYPRPGAQSQAEPVYAFDFDSAVAALQAYRDRLLGAADLAANVAKAGLEIAGEYKENLHDAYFETYGKAGLQPEDLALFPNYFIRLSTDRLNPEESAAVSEILSAGLPMKILIQTDDILDELPLAGRQLGYSRQSRLLVQTALGLNDVFVLQTGSSHLFQMRNEASRGLGFSGPALFHVFSGAVKTTEGFPAYLVAAAATESRAFPAFIYDPLAGPDRDNRFELAVNPQIESDWPVQRLVYEDEEHQRVVEDLPFTLADFAALDRRFAGHFARLPREEWNGSLASVSDGMTHPESGLPEKLPSVLMVDGNGRLQKLLVDEDLMRETRRCLRSWRLLRELGRLKVVPLPVPPAVEKELPTEPAEKTASAPAAPTASKPAAAPVEAEPASSSDDPYIETPRCTSCNECTGINNKMFAYNENKQAYVANPDAGTYAQLVEAAESCQVAIIHPGKPRNSNEPGLDELLQRAEPFR